jgi:phosphoribosylanthranilate isomerase
MSTFVKFSGLTEPAAVALVPEGGAAGFVVGDEKDPRALSIEAARRLAEAVPSGAEVWAVTRAPSAAFVRALFDELGVDRIQVFGPVPEELEFLETHHIVPSIPVPVEADGAVPKVPTPERHPILQLDAASAPIGGGSPVRPNWEICRTLLEANPGRKLVLAGGLTPENVAEALGSLRPWGVDVCAGVEGPDGRKDPSRMRSFLESVRRADGSSG